MRVYIVVAIAVFTLAIVVQPAMAFTEISIPFITTDCAVFTFPNGNTALTILEFNSASTSLTSAEKLDINFPLFSDGFVAGPSKISGVSDINGASFNSGKAENIIPFGLVNLALPSIAQTAVETIACQRTYFFTDTFG